MSHSSVEIANEFLRLAGGKLTQMQVQKLAYIAHGWNLVVNKEPLISERPEAWQYGPVYPDLYEHTKYFGKDPIGREITPDDGMFARFFGSSEKPEPAYKADLTVGERNVIAAVWKRYGSLSAARLSELTHQPDTPWYEAYSKSGRGTKLEDVSIKEHYLKLAHRASHAAN